MPGRKKVNERCGTFKIMLKLRDYQNLGNQQLFDKIRLGKKRIIWWLQTGGGKGAVMAWLAEASLKKNKKTLVIMRRRELIFQTKENFKNYCGIDASIIMSTEKGFDIDKHVQICSVDTIRNRIKKPSYAFLKNFDVIQVDEMQDTTSLTYQNIFEFLGDKIYVGFTATPFAVGTKVHDFWEDYIKPIEAHELRDQGFLVPVKMFRPTKIDISGIRSIGGDYDTNELFDRVSKLQVIGDIVDNYKEYGDDKPAILFAVNKAHSIMMAEAFKQAGIPAIHQDESHNSLERQLAIKGLKEGIYKVLCNVNIFSTGVDIPCAEIGIMARPSQSEILVCQQWGRLLRPFKICALCDTQFGGEKLCPKCEYNRYKYEKKFAKILDHAGNVDRFGFPYDVRDAELTKLMRKKKKKENEEKKVAAIECPKCFYLFESKLDRCPECGYIRKVQNNLNEKDGELEEYSEGQRDDEFIEKMNSYIRKLRYTLKNYEYCRPGYLAKKLYGKYNIHCIRLIDKLKLTDQEKQEVLNEREKKLLQSTSVFT